MQVCKRCGVEIEERLKSCPLCKLPLGNNFEPIETKIIKSQSIVPKIIRQTKSWIWELVTFLSFATFIVIFAVDFAYGTKITWSRFPLASIIFVWLTFTLMIRLKKRTYLLIIVESLILLLLLRVLDLFITAKPWFFRLALPIVLCLSLISILSILFVRKNRLSIFGILATCMTNSGFFLLFLDAILHSFTKGKPFISWSIVAFAASFRWSFSCSISKKN